MFRKSQIAIQKPHNFLKQWYLVAFCASESENLLNAAFFIAGVRM
jgi:hypothetical protein